ncbi:hypothetical protein [Cycloclasticus sp.]|uniref:hypothetical protein n=1 Tax=Cycloclasticus sp. TaxID=2024830 RepID=UPI000C120E20|nr:hypothetical protein [Cycloclasticus sp.]PHR48634.1 MAG: hypothetical protein COA48_10085 [Cycloclasticus sp.]
MNLTESEKTLIESLPKPPAVARLHVTNIWIIEWLSIGERRTGEELHDWMEQQRPGWSIYNRCTSKEEVIRSIERAAYSTQQNGMAPVLHIEAHGNLIGIAPSRDKQAELLRWEELTLPLQQLNIATKCNLVIVVAACLGFAAIQALTQSPRAPAIALVGTDATVNESDLLLGTKEFYRCIRGENSRLTEIAETSSREMCSTDFEVEPFAMLAYEALVEQVIKRIRPVERHALIEKLRNRMHRETSFSMDVIERRLSQLPDIPPSADLQETWDQMFMIDIYPTNEERFGLNWDNVIGQILAASSNQ